MKLTTKKRLTVERCLVATLLNDHFKSSGSDVRIPALKYIYIGAGSQIDTIEIEWDEDAESTKETAEAKKDK